MGSQRPDTSEPGSSFTLMKPREGTLGSNCAGLAQVGQIQSLGEILDATSCGQFEQDDRRCLALPYWIELLIPWLWENPTRLRAPAPALTARCPNFVHFSPILKKRCDNS